MSDDHPIIDNPLAWQETMDAKETEGQSINTHGSERFWRTVASRGLPVVYRNGGPDFSEIVFDLGDDIGLMLYTERVEEDDDYSPVAHIRYRFVAIARE